MCRYMYLHVYVCTCTGTQLHLHMYMHCVMKGRRGGSQILDPPTAVIGVESRYINQVPMQTITGRNYCWCFRIHAWVSPHPISMYIKTITLNL